MNFEEEFRSHFGDKYSNVVLKEVVVKKSQGICTITFLYPSTDKELSDAEKKEITNFIKSKLEIEKLSLKIKFMRVFVEEKLILKSILEFFEKKYILISTYINEKNIKIKKTPIDVLVEIVASKRIENFFIEHKITAELAKPLKQNFLTECVVSLQIDENLVDDVDIENVEISTVARPNKRYSVEIIKDIVGTNKMTRPEYISFITGPKEAVVVAGFISKFNRREFIRKTGKFAGQPKAYYNFVLQDEKGAIDCIYFSSKTNQQVMDSLEDSMYVLVHGNVEKSKFTDKLVLVVDKLSLATKDIEIEEKPKQEVKKKKTKNVVEIENITTLRQVDVFGSKVEYNDTINGKTYVVFDIETTGLDVSSDEITEIGAVKIVDGQIKEKFASFVKPTKSIPKEVTELTGITNEMVEDAPDAEFVLQEFYEFSKDAILCGHNIIGFDLKIVKRMGNEYGIDFDNEVLDTLNLARVSHLLVSNFKLGTIVKYLGLTLEGAHRAWNDAYATAEVLLKLCEKNNNF